MTDSHSMAQKHENCDSLPSDAVGITYWHPSKTYDNNYVRQFVDNWCSVMPDIPLYVACPSTHLAQHVWPAKIAHAQFQYHSWWIMAALYHPAIHHLHRIGYSLDVKPLLHPNSFLSHRKAATCYMPDRRWRKWTDWVVQVPPNHPFNDFWKQLKAVKHLPRIRGSTGPDRELTKWLDSHHYKPHKIKPPTAACLVSSSHQQPFSDKTAFIHSFKSPHLDDPRLNTLKTTPKPDYNTQAQAHKHTADITLK